MEGTGPRLPQDSGPLERLRAEAPTAPPSRIRAADGPVRDRAPQDRPQAVRDRLPLWQRRARAGLPDRRAGARGGHLPAGHGLPPGAGARGRGGGPGQERAAVHGGDRQPAVPGRGRTGRRVDRVAHARQGAAVGTRDRQLLRGGRQAARREEPQVAERPVRALHEAVAAPDRAVGRGRARLHHQPQLHRQPDLPRDAVGAAVGVRFARGAGPARQHEEEGDRARRRQGRERLRHRAGGGDRSVREGPADEWEQGVAGGRRRGPPPRPVGRAGRTSTCG